MFKDGHKRRFKLKQRQISNRIYKACGAYWIL